MILSDILSNDLGLLLRAWGGGEGEGREDDFSKPKDLIGLTCGIIWDQVTRVKVEPKTFFANERTFIQWLTAGMLLGTLSLAFLDIREDTPGIGFIVVAILILLYALVVFQWRSCRIRQVRAALIGTPRDRSQRRHTLIAL